MIREAGAGERVARKIIVDDDAIPKVQIDGTPYLMIEMNFRKPGKGNALYECKLRNLLRGTTTELVSAGVTYLDYSVGANAGSSAVTVSIKWGSERPSRSS